MKNRTLSIFYTKIFGCCSAVIILCIMATIISKNWHNLIIGIFGIAVFLITYFETKNADKNGNLITVFGECYETSGKRVVISRDAVKYTYAFALKEIDGEGNLYLPEEPSSIYVESNKEKFRRGETYCLIFKKTSSGELNEKNLVTYSVVFPELDLTEGGV